VLRVDGSRSEAKADRAAADFRKSSQPVRLLRVQVFPTYDERVKQIPCVCGYVVRGEDDDELWQNAQDHLRQDHPDLVGKVSRADLLAQTEEIPKPTS
jgi:predicted small metal-binding protein